MCRSEVTGLAPITPFDIGVRRYVEWYQSTEAERGKQLAPALT